MKKNDLATIGGAGCLLAIPAALWAGFKFAMKYASDKEHHMAHQVEEVELEGVAAAQRDVAIGPKQDLTRFFKKLQRTTEQFAKLGGRFSPEDHAAHTTRLNGIMARLKDPDSECQAMLQQAQASIMQYAPPGS